MSQSNGLKQALENARIAREMGEHVTDAQIRRAAARIEKAQKPREVDEDAGGFGLHRGHLEAAKRKRGPMVSLAGCTWPPVRKNGPECGRWVYRDGKLIPIEKVQTARADAPAVLDDKLYAGWNPALRMHIRSRTHEREELKRRGLRPLFG